MSVDLQLLRIAFAELPRTRKIHVMQQFELLPSRNIDRFSDARLAEEAFAKAYARGITQKLAEAIERLTGKPI